VNGRSGRDEDLTLDQVCAALASSGWTGFSLARRYLRAHPGALRELARRLEAGDRDVFADREARTVRWAFLAESSTLNLRDRLTIESLLRGMFVEQYHAPAGAIAREVADPSSGLWAHRPDVVVVHPFTAAGAGGELEIPPKERLSELLQQLREGTEAVILVHNLVAPELRPLGVVDWVEPGGIGARVARFNLELADLCHETTGAYVVDLAPLLSLARAGYWTLHRSAFLADLALPDEIGACLCGQYAAVGAALRGLVRKCLVVDLDDTLWGGVVGEVGAGGVAIGQGFPGNVFRSIQGAVRQLHENGAVLAISSRNNEEDAWEPFDTRPEMVLKREHFAAWRINWEDKVESLREISDELGLALDSFVVLDDNPVNRYWIETQLPEVWVLSAQDPLDMVRELATTRLFEGLERTAEDRLRGRSYAARPRRLRSERGEADRETFLTELELEVTAGRASPPQLPRLAQLSQRTNQFNLTTRRHTQNQLAELLASEDSEVIYCSCRDRFSDEGIIGLALLVGNGAEWRIDSLLLSCRVLGWGVESCLAEVVRQMAKERGAEVLQGVYVASGRNAQTRLFYEKLGFLLVASDEQGSTWELDPRSSASLSPRWIELARVDEP